MATWGPPCPLYRLQPLSLLISILCQIPSLLLCLAVVPLRPSRGAFTPRCRCLADGALSLSRREEEEKDDRYPVSPQAGPALQVRPADRRLGRAAGPDPHRVELQQPGLRRRRGRRRQEPGEERGASRGAKQSRQGAPAEGAAKEGRPAAAREGGRTAQAAGGKV